MGQGLFSAVKPVMGQGLYSAVMGQGLYSAVMGQGLYNAEILKNKLNNKIFQVLSSTLDHFRRSQESGLCPRGRKKEMSARASSRKGFYLVAQHLTSSQL